MISLISSVLRGRLSMSLTNLPNPFQLGIDSHSEHNSSGATFTSIGKVTLNIPEACGMNIP